MSRASSSLRWIETAFWLAGLALAGIALGATWDRWHYQKSQQQALFADDTAAGEIPAAVLPSAADPAPVPLPVKLPDDHQKEPTVVEANSSLAPAPLPRTPRPRPRPKKVHLDPGVIGRIEIPRIGLAAIVREGDDADTLERAVGLIPGTARPGDRGNAVLAAHRDTFFRPLRDIRIDDRIRLRVPGSSYEYKVESTAVVEPDDVGVLASDGTEALTLITCYPFRYIGPAPQRFIVRAMRVR